MNDDTDPDAPARVPKYKAPDFMRKEMALFLRARNETAIMRRNGDDDSPVRPISAISSVRAIRPVIEINHLIR